MIELSARAAALLATVFVLPQVGRANELDRSAWVQLGAYRPAIDSHLRVDSSRGPGSTIDFERDLGLDDSKTVGALLIGARWAERWRFEFEYFELTRGTRQHLIDRDIVIDEITYPAQVEITSEFDTKVYRAGVGYAFLREPDAEAGVIGGLHVTTFRAAFEGLGSFNGSLLAVQKDRRDETVPLPTVGAFGTWLVSPQWLLSGRADLFYLKFDHYRGRLFNLQGNVMYRVSPNVSLGAGYRLTDYRLDADDAGWRGRLELTYKGPQLVLEAGF